MAIYLNEDEFGEDIACIGFPHMLLCMGLVVMTQLPNSLYGAHLPWPNASGHKVVHALRAHMGAAANNITAIYGCCRWSQRYAKHSYAQNLNAWTQEMKTIAGIFGWNGLQNGDDLRGFDTRLVDGNTTDGVYVEYTPDFANTRCKVFHKKNQLMTFNTGLNPANQWKVNTMGVVNPSVNATINGAVSPGNGQLDEINYQIQLTAIGV